MKKFLLFLFILAVLAIIIVAAVFLLTSGVTQSADRFFKTIESGDIAGAYDSLSEDFKAATSRAELEAFLENTALGNYESSTWTSRSVSGSTGTVEGTVNTKDGGAVPIKIDFVKEGGDWKILSIEKAASGLVEEPETGKTVPEDADLRRMTDATMQDFARAVNAADFTEFHANLSELWKNQVTPGELLEIFKTFIDQEADLTVLSNYEAVYSEVPGLNDDGLLELTGYYPTQPSVAYFTLKYIYEHPNWKLAGIHLNLK